MEPVHGGRDDFGSLVTAEGGPGGPQWSPSTEDGTTGDDRAHGPAGPGAAMEPVHGGRDDPALR